MSDIKTKKSEELVTCEICGKTHKRSEWNKMNIKLIKGAKKEDGTTPRVCEECIKKSYKTIENFKKKQKDKEMKIKAEELRTPRDIKAELDKWVIDQDRPKKALATELYAHRKRMERIINDPDAVENLRMDKSNIIYIGPTGSGRE